MPELTDYRQDYSKITQNEVFRLHDVAAEVQFIAAKYSDRLIDESKAMGMIQQILSELDPLLDSYNKPLMLWPIPVLEFLHAVRRTGLKISFVENMFLQYEITERFFAKQPTITNTEIINAINQDRKEAMELAKENALEKCMAQMKIDPNEARQRLDIQEYMQEPDDNFFFVVWDKKTQRAVSKRTYYKKLLL